VNEHLTWYHIDI